MQRREGNHSNVAPQHTAKPILVSNAPAPSSSAPSASSLMLAEEQARAQAIFMQGKAEAPASTPTSTPQHSTLAEEQAKAQAAFLKQQALHVQMASNKSQREVRKKERKKERNHPIYLLPYLNFEIGSQIDYIKKTDKPPTCCSICC